MQAILPLKIAKSSHPHELARASLLIKSLECNQEENITVHVICREEELEQVQSGLISSTIDLIFHNEDRIISNIGAHSSLGWYKQQAIKLAAYKIITEDYYVTLDADLIAAAPIASRRFLVDGKAIADWGPKTMHPEWWKRSAQIIGVPADLHGLGLSVTPEVLFPALCSKLDDFLLMKYGTDPWLRLLEQEGWTEYSLYNTFCDFKNLTWSFYHSPQWLSENNLRLRMEGRRNFWHTEQYALWSPPKKKDDGPGVFMVCQSRTHIPPEYIWDQVAHLFDNAGSGDGFRYKVDYVKLLIILYRTLLQRAPAGPEFSSDLSALEQTGDIGAVINRMIKSKEFLGRRNAGHAT